MKTNFFTMAISEGHNTLTTYEFVLISKKDGNFFGPHHSLFTENCFKAISLKLKRSKFEIKHHFLTLITHLYVIFFVFL